MDTFKFNKTTSAAINAALQSEAIVRNISWDLKLLDSGVEIPEGQLDDFRAKIIHICESAESRFSITTITAIYKEAVGRKPFLKSIGAWDAVLAALSL